MISKRLFLALCITSWCVVEVSSTVFDLRLFDLDSGRFSKTRSQWSKNPRNISASRIDFQNPPILHFIEIVGQFGYPAEEHSITTVDGYKLNIHRIPGSNAVPKARGKPVVFFQHGLLASSDTWVLFGPDRDLSYMMVDDGYDVWFGNSRGTTYSRSHVHLNPDSDPLYWQFSFHEIALYDVTASIDYILELTGQSSLLCIAHSMGTTISYVLLSTRPEYNDKVWLLVSLAPISSWHAGHTWLGQLLVDNTALITNEVLNNGIEEIFPLSFEQQRWTKRFCRKNSIFLPFCLLVYSMLDGFDSDQLDTDWLPYLFSYVPAGVSTKTLFHFNQNMRSGDFKQFDYGTKRNLEIYGQANPPFYDLKNIVAPIVMFYGERDAILKLENVANLAKALPNVIAMNPVENKNFGHLDFVWAKDLKRLINFRVMNTTARFRQGMVTKTIHNLKNKDHKGT